MLDHERMRFGLTENYLRPRRKKYVRINGKVDGSLRAAVDGIKTGLGPDAPIYQCTIMVESEVSEYTGELTTPSNTLTQIELLSDPSNEAG
jgi:hypothetical protein